MKTHYQLLGLDPEALADEIKRAFRREIARYHPDKVQHLGGEFQEIAATRAAELTEAYRVLMDTASRRRYDDAFGRGVGSDPDPASAQPPPSGTAPPAEAPARSKSAEPEALRERVDRQFRHERATTGDVLRKAAIAKLRDAVGRVNGSAEPLAVAGFDAAYVITPRRSLFKRAESHVRLLARFVSPVDGPAVEEAWPLATKSGAFDGVTCLMLLGSGVSSAEELGIAVAEQRRKTRIGAPVVVPVDVRDWQALFPPEVPDVLRQVVHRLRDGS